MVLYAAAGLRPDWLTPGEFGLVAFIVFAIVTARYWPSVGERIALKLSPADKAKDHGGESGP